MTKKGIYINQQDNFQGKFGYVLRSSAIFYYRNDMNCNTTISFMNYWKFKRGLDITVIASVRNMEGKLIIRENLSFKEGNVINYRPFQGEDFEGSVEIEIYSIQNMIIPYAAIVAIYHTQKGISFVHSYARAYSRHEIEDGLCITQGEESCWTVRDNDFYRSFGIFHNGPRKLESQTVLMTLSSHEGEIQTTTFNLPELLPYQTIKIKPEDHFKNIISFLNKQPGNLNISFNLGESFTRMLIGNETRNQDDMQVTHSNFNYSRHETDKLESTIKEAYMVIPSLGIKGKSVVVFPDCDPGNYQILADNKKIPFNGRKRLEFTYDQGTLSFTKPGYPIPSRLVTSLISQKNSERIPNECSLNIITIKQPPKRMWWGLTAMQSDLKSKIIIHDLPEVYGGMDEDKTFCIRLFSCNTNDYLEKILSKSDLYKFDDGYYLHDLFTNAESFLDGDFGYYTVYSEYGGLTVYSTLENTSGSIALEHGF